MHFLCPSVLVFHPLILVYIKVILAISSTFTFIIDTVTPCWLRNILFKMQGKSRIQIFYILSAWNALSCEVGKRIIIIKSIFESLVSS